MNRRSKSRDSQFPDPGYNRHKAESDLSARRPKQYPHAKASLVSNEFSATLPTKKSETYKSDPSNKKATFIGRKKVKEGPSEESTSKAANSQFENDFTPSENESPNLVSGSFSFENDFEVETEPKALRARIDQKVKSHFPPSSASLKQKSLFEDDFSPTERLHFHEDSKISSIQEEQTSSIAQPKTEKTVSSRKRILSRNRLSSNLKSDSNLKKSESVNIFARENDPFDDAFFAEESSDLHEEKASSRGSDIKWSENFQDFDMTEEN